MSFRKETLAEGVELYCGDCLEVLPTLGRFDAVVTDPPYGINQASWDEVVPLDWFGLALPLIGADGAAYIFGDALTISQFQMYWEQKGVAWASRIAWVYEDGPRNAAAWTSKHEDCLFYKGSSHRLVTPTEPSIHKDPRWGDDRFLGDVWRHGRVKGNANDRTEHPTQKPVSLIELPIRGSSVEGGTILDPFMGSGTTGVAAVKLGRKFTGIEIDPGYFDIACRRIAAALKEPDMFIEPPKPAKQETLQLDGAV